MTKKDILKVILKYEEFKNKLQQIDLKKRMHLLSVENARKLIVEAEIDLHNYIENEVN